MKIALVGATGFLGSKILAEAIDEVENPQHTGRRFTVGYNSITFNHLCARRTIGRRTSPKPESEIRVNRRS